MGLIKFGTFFSFVSLAVISGFTSAAAIIIALNQIKSMMGISLSGYTNIVDYVSKLMHHATNANLYTIGIGIGSLILLIVIKKRFLASPGPLIVIVTSIVVVNYFQFYRNGVDIVGEIPRQLPDFSLHIPSVEIFLIVISSCLYDCIHFIC